MAMRVQDTIPEGRCKSSAPALYTGKDSNSRHAIGSSFFWELSVRHAVRIYDGAFQDDSNGTSLFELSKSLLIVIFSLNANMYIFVHRISFVNIAYL